MNVLEEGDLEGVASVAGPHALSLHESALVIYHQLLLDHVKGLDDLLKGRARETTKTLQTAKLLNK